MAYGISGGGSLITARTVGLQQTTKAIRLTGES